MRKALLAVAFPVAASGYKVLVDLNTWNAQELASLPNVGKHDGTWVIHVNSPGVSDDFWRKSIYGDPIITEDNPMSFAECQWLGRLLGAGPTYAMGYHEDAITPSPTKTLLNWGEVDQYVRNCHGHQVVALTRAYWPGSDWEQHTNAILNHPSLGGVAMEYNPNDTGLRAEDHFVSSMLAANRKAFFLWPLKFNSKPTEQNILDSLNWMRSHGVNLADPRVHFVIARYDTPHIPVMGASNSVESAVKAALRFRASLDGLSLSHPALAGPALRSVGYQNPVLGMDFPDPAVVRGRDRAFYAFATMGNGHRIQMAKSTDLGYWQFLGEALNPAPAWGDGRTFWAPDVVFVQALNKFVMYYAGQRREGNHCIGAALANDAWGPFVDVGAPLVCRDGFQAIDPKRVDTAQGSFLFWGSGPGIFVATLDPNGWNLTHGDDSQQVISNANLDYERLVEGAWVDFDAGFPGGGRYWLYYSGDGCCGAGAHYAVSVATTDAQHPGSIYAKRNDPARGGSSTILTGNDAFQAPGHNSIIRDDAGNAWMLYHAYRGGDRGARVLMLDRVVYKDGWPWVGTPSSSPQEGPMISAAELDGTPPLVVV